MGQLVRGQWREKGIGLKVDITREGERERGDWPES